MVTARALVILSLIAGASASASAQEPQAEIPPPMMAVAKTPVSPTIDGTLAPGEWRYAAAATGFVNLADANLAPVQTTVFVTYDARRLYVGFELPVDPEELPTAAVTERDGGVNADDSFEIYLLRAGDEPGEYYQLVGNAAGAILDLHGRDRSWNGDWQFVNSVERGHWSAELSIAWSELGVGDPTGETWRAQFARSAGLWTAWAYTVRGYNNPERWGFLEFAGEGAVTRFTAIDAAAPGSVSVEGESVLVAGEGRQLSVGADLTEFGPAVEKSLPAPNNRDWREKRTSTITPGAVVPFRLTLETGGEGRRLLYLGGADALGNRVFAQVIPLVARVPEYVRLLADPAERFAWVRADLRTVRAPERVDVHLRARQRGGEFVAISKHPGPRVGAERSVQQDVRAWPEGMYDCAWRIVDPGSGEVLRSGACEYERRASPQWYRQGTRLGRTETVPAPWEPMRTSADAIEVWGRRYELAGTPLLGQISSADAELLAGPVRLECAAGGAVLPLAIEKRLVTRTRDTDCELLATGALGPLRAQVSTRGEFDGMLRFDVRLLAEPAAPVEGLRLVIPLRPERALYYHHCSSYYARGYAGELPAEGLTLGFRPFVWLGDDERGLMWFAESPRDWTVEGDPITVRRTADATELVIALINTPTTVGARWYTFGLQATPVKPVPPDWRAWRVDRVWPRRSQATMELRWEERGVPLNWRYLWFADGAAPLYGNAHTAPLDVMDTLGDFTAQYHALGTRLLPYLYLHGVSTTATDFERYYPVWQTSSPRQIGGGDRVIMGACPGSSFGDYLLYGIDRWATQYGVDGVYFDGAGPPVECANELHDHGWVADGARSVEYPIFGLREFYKRLWIALSARVEDPAIWIHADGKMAPPCFGFATANWEGEMVQGPLLTGGAYLSDLLPLDFWRAHLMATQWGVVPMWLVTTCRTDEEMQRRQMFDTLALMLVHGTPWARRGHIAADLTERIWTAQEQFGIGRANFHGYWQNADLVRITPQDPRIVASLYERDGRVLLIVANLTEEATEVTVALAEGVRPAGAEMVDVITDATETVADGVLTLTVGAKAFRMLEG